MNIEDLIVNRRTIHQYTDKKVDESLIDRALELGHLAPNHRLTQPVRYIKTTDKTREKLFDLAYKMKSAKTPLSPEKTELIKKLYTQTSHLLVLTQKRDENPLVAKEDYATLSMAIQNIALFLWEKKVGTKWTSGGIIREPSTYEILSINPNEELIEAFLWIGYPAKIKEVIPRDNVKNFIRSV